MINEKKINVIIVDDHELVRKGFADSIKDDESLVLIAEAGNGTEGYEKIQKFKPDVAVVDIELPGMGGLEISKLIRKELPNTEIVILTGHTEEGLFIEAMGIGISGYILKESSAEDLISAIKRVCKGETYLAPRFHKILLDLYKKKQEFYDEKPAIQELTQQELKVIKIVAENKSNKEIAEELSIAVKTVETHRNNICKKLNLKGNHALLVFALQNKHLI